MLANTTRVPFYRSRQDPEELLVPPAQPGVDDLMHTSKDAKTRYGSCAEENEFIFTIIILFVFLN